MAPVAALAPNGVVTVTLTVPAASAGATAPVIEVVEATVQPAVAVVAPKLTTLAPVKLVPVMFTAVPPAVGPSTTLSAVTVGTAS